MALSEENKKELRDFDEKIEEFLPEISSFIDGLFEGSSFAFKAIAAERICFEAINYGSTNVYEAVGILDCVKRKYFEIAEEVFDEEDEELFEEEEINKSNLH